MEEKPHRLSKNPYRGHQAVALTCCINERKNCFITDKVFRVIENIFLQSLQKYTVNAHVYLFMPDHLHMVLEGKDQNANMYECMLRFKQRSSFWLSKNLGMRWQKDFYDHILRKDEEIEKHVRYILENPVRRGITNDWKAYPYKGSTTYNFNQW